jgi:hypothetical protein
MSAAAVVFVAPPLLSPSAMAWVRAKARSEIRRTRWVLDASGGRLPLLGRRACPSIQTDARTRGHANGGIPELSPLARTRCGRRLLKHYEIKGSLGLVKKLRSFAVRPRFRGEPVPLLRIIELWWRPVCGSGARWRLAAK